MKYTTDVPVYCIDVSSSCTAKRCRKIFSLSVHGSVAQSANKGLEPSAKQTIFFRPCSHIAYVFRPSKVRLFSGCANTVTALL